MTVIFATSELNPIAKVGGLADVAGALPKALAALGVDVAVVMPRYDTIDTARFPIADTGKWISVAAGGANRTVRIFQTTIPGSRVSVYLLEEPTYLTGGGIYFEKSAIADSFQELGRFTFFSKAILPALAALRIDPDVIHCQDWHTGLVPVFAKLAGCRAKTLFTIHNLANQGKWAAPELLAFLHLDDDAVPTFARRDALNDLNLIQQGILNADSVNTVSPNYAQEILTPEYGYGLEGDLAARQREGHLVGILNGIDTEAFNPATDQHIPQTYTQETVTTGKAAAKAALVAKYGLRESTGPLLGFVGRLTDQKGTELLPPILDRFLAAGAQLVILGTGYDVLEKEATAMAVRAPGQVGVTIGFDAALAQTIYAGCDYFLMPSRFEPCGLGQMIAMRYGTPAIVRAVGGLKDSVQDFDPKAGSGTGFTFAPFDADALLAATLRAIEVFKDQTQYATLRSNAMIQDFSWQHSAVAYQNLYTTLTR